jgi:hypothetical protein
MYTFLFFAYFARLPEEFAISNCVINQGVRPVLVWVLLPVLDYIFIRLAITSLPVILANALYICIAMSPHVIPRACFALVKMTVTHPFVFIEITERFYFPAFETFFPGHSRLYIYCPEVAYHTQKGT